MNWALRYAPHLGYSPPDRLLFRALAGSDPADHVRFAASEGMAGIMDPWAPYRPAAQRQTIKSALEETGLKCGCVVSLPLAKVREPLWVANGAEAELLGHLRHALAVASDLGSTNIAVLLVGEAETAPAVQRRRAIERLRMAADVAAKQGATLAIEPMKVFPGMLLGSFAEGVDLVREADHVGIKLIYDTGHVVSMKEPVLETFVDGYSEIAVIQLADMPGRVEVGGGEIDFVPILAHALRQGYDGLIELEHDWTEPGPEGERRGIERLQSVDAKARLSAAQA